MNTKEIVYAFIDSQNLHLDIKSQGWKLDFKRFRVYLQDKYKVEKAFLFIGYLPQYTNLYKKLTSCGYELIFKPTIRQKAKIKGNVDSELVLYTSAIEFPNYDKAIIVSGDGDFYCLVKYLLDKNKLECIFIPNKKASSNLFNQFYKYLRFIGEIRNKVE